METNWERTFEEVGAFWRHDGNPKRPYALLTSGKISNVFFNGSKVIERPPLLQEVARVLNARAKEIFPALKPTAVVGPAHGAITLAYEVARTFSSARAWFTEEDGGGRIVLKRFDARNDDEVLVVEDAVTTGGSAMGTVSALQHLKPAPQVYPFLLCILNRSGSSSLPNGPKIISLVEISARTWERGRNPFTSDGQELVEPIRPKANWDKLTRPY